MKKLSVLENMQRVSGVLFDLCVVYLVLIDFSVCKQLIAVKYVWGFVYVMEAWYWIISVPMFFCTLYFLVIYLNIKQTRSISLLFKNGLSLEKNKELIAPFKRKICSVRATIFYWCDSIPITLLCGIVLQDMSLFCVQAILGIITFTLKECTAGIFDRISHELDLANAAKSFVPNEPEKSS